MSVSTIPLSYQTGSHHPLYKGWHIGEKIRPSSENCKHKFKHACRYPFLKWLSFLKFYWLLDPSIKKNLTGTNYQLNIQISSSKIKLKKRNRSSSQAQTITNIRFTATHQFKLTNRSPKRILHQQHDRNWETAWWN